MDSQVKYMLSYLADSSRCMANIESDATLQKIVLEVAGECVYALKSGRKLLFIGNGGSAADCQHMAGEYVSRFNFERSGLAAIALTTDTSILTAIGNDYGYENVFKRQLEALACPGDVLFAYSTSGTSKNILKAIEACHNLGVITVLLTGNRPESMKVPSDYIIQIPHESTPHIQEGHGVIGHLICGLVEKLYYNK